MGINFGACFMALVFGIWLFAQETNRDEGASIGIFIFMMIALFCSGVMIFIRAFRSHFRGYQIHEPVMPTVDQEQ